ncbi:hypothetical protein M3914_003457 [Vibrio metschnikovii]|nr:hypothetical protein [Vibrio metschnikovii]EKO3612239.1 hypothetical protein [Vibrio metschnikovii]EKO3684973.1 hypothetical protein [Vibrio metschnikovii]
MRNVYTKVHNLHFEEYQLMEHLDKQEYNRTKDDETDENYDYSYSDRLQELELLFYRIHRVSTLLMIYSFLEHSMMRICSIYEKKLNIPISVSELSGSGIYRCKIYLSKFVNFDFDEKSIKQDWDFLQIMNKLRNSLAHEEGYLSEKSKIKAKTINGTPGLSMYHDTILISHEFVLDAFNTTERLLIRLCENKI